MINYSNTKPGDILRIVAPGAPGYAAIGDLVRVTKVFHNGVKVENKMGEPCEFVYNCGAARLEETEWKQDFPAVVGGAEPAGSQASDGTRASSHSTERRQSPGEISPTTHDDQS